MLFSNVAEINVNSSSRRGTHTSSWCVVVRVPARCSRGGAPPPAIRAVTGDCAPPPAWVDKQGPRGPLFYRTSVIVLIMKYKSVKWKTIVAKTYFYISLGVVSGWSAGCRISPLIIGFEFRTFGPESGLVQRFQNRRANDHQISHTPHRYTTSQTHT